MMNDKTIERTEYLQHPLIEDVVYHISDDRVLVQSSNTLFLQAVKREKIPLSQVERLFRELKKVAKDTGKIRLKGVTKFLPAVRALYPLYSTAVDTMNRNFAEIVVITRQLQSDGIHYGCSDDGLLKAAIEKEHEISRFCWRSSEYSRFLGYYKNVHTALQNREWENSNLLHCTIYIAS